MRGDFSGEEIAKASRKKKNDYLYLCVEIPHILFNGGLDTISTIFQRPSVSWDSLQPCGTLPRIFGDVFDNIICTS